MKKLLLTLATTILVISANAHTKHPQKKNSKKLPPLEHRCTSDLKNGKQCTNWSMTDSEYCWKHGFGSK